MGSKRVLVISDLHSGHQVGFSPPGYHVAQIDDPRQHRWARVRREVWQYFFTQLEPYRPIDILIVNGDALEGKGIRSGSTELITADRKVQCEIAKEGINNIGASVIRMSYGTASHTGTEEDWEDIIADAVGAKIGSHEWIEVNGVVIDYKHKIGSSSIPHGRLTPLAKEILWNRLWHSRGMAPKANILLRSHDHYFEHCDHDECLGFITPCLQGFGSKFGSRECSGTVDIGFLVFDISEEGKITWSKEMIKGQTQIAIPERL